LLVEVQLACGDLAAADETFDQLAALAVEREDDRTRAVARLVEARSELLEETGKRGRTSRRPWSCSRRSVFPSKPRRRGSRSRGRWVACAGSSRMPALASQEGIG
jgi:hypothetical protein